MLPNCVQEKRHSAADTSARSCRAFFLRLGCFFLRLGFDTGAVQGLGTGFVAPQKRRIIGFSRLQLADTAPCSFFASVQHWTWD